MNLKNLCFLVYTRGNKAVDKDSDYNFGCAALKTHFCPSSKKKNPKHKNAIY